MKYGLNDKDIHFIKETLSNNLKEEFSIFIFGLGARGDHSEFSDLDLMLESSQDYTQQISNLIEIFEESTLPIKVDLVQERDFAHSYREKYLNERIKFI